MPIKAVVSCALLVASILPCAVYSGPLLKANGVSTEQDAKDYYKMIDPGNARLTQSDWKEVNGFNSLLNLNQVVVVAGHKNVSDLGFWRRIDMVIDKRPGYVGNVAMTTYNFEVGPNDANPQGLSKCCDPANAASIVNMEYSPGPDGDRITKFYIYDAAGNRKYSTFFDPVVARREELYLPNGCAACHGGGGGRNFMVRGGDTGGGFVAFDFNVFSYAGSNTTQALNEENVKKLNQGVLMTNPDGAVRGHVRGLYGGRTLPLATQNTAYRPASWDTEPALWGAVVRNCEGCHTQSEEDILSLNYWKTSARSIREETFKERLMPNSPNGRDNFFFGSSGDRQIVDEALRRFGAP
jgi:hypothetical protein